MRYRIVSKIVQMHTVCSMIIELNQAKISNSILMNHIIDVLDIPYDLIEIHLEFSLRREQTPFFYFVMSPLELTTEFR